MFSRWLIPGMPSALAIVFSSSSSSDLRSIRISCDALSWLTIRLPVKASRSCPSRQGTVSTPMSSRMRYRRQPSRIS